MPAYQLVRCTIALGGDQGNTVVRGRHNPLTYPELQMAQLLHGEDAVTGIHVVGTAQMTNDQMADRLKVLYREEYVKEMFPGARPRYPLGDPNLPKCTQPVYRARKVVPDNPDPKLRPLVMDLDQVDELDAPDTEPEPVPAEPYGGSDLTADQIGGHQDEDADDEPPLDDVILGLAPGVSMNDQVTMPHVKARNAHAPRDRDHLPDVAVPTYTRDNNAKRAEHKGRGASR